MLFLVLDMFVLWFLLNIITEEDWSDEKFKLFLMSLSITILGGVATNALAEQIGLLSLGVYLIIGIIVLYALASITLKEAAIVMAVFLVYKVLATLALMAAFSNV